MRAVFSVRFVAAVAAVVGLFGLMWWFTTWPEDDSEIATASSAPPDESLAEPPMERHLDLLAPVVNINNDSFSVVDGVASSTTFVELDQARQVRILVDTPGVNICTGFRAVQGCVIALDLLGEAVVWFGLIPAGSDRTVTLPAIDQLIEGRAHLVNGWTVPYAPVLDRRCADDGDPETRDEFESYGEFREVLGSDFNSIYHFDERQLIAVTCREPVSWVDESVTVVTTDTTVPG